MLKLRNFMYVHVCLYAHFEFDAINVINIFTFYMVP